MFTLQIVPLFTELGFSVWFWGHVVPARVYYTRIAYYAYKEDKGFSFDNIPTAENDGCIIRLTIYGRSSPACM
ncbi:hypothetical protein ZIOFF_070695 [Zingiber officinale]|uniref:Uncharacterized protein n=1 Tax=Zingiber officinale TaxID=94328 RepID=A0A8J5C7F7_ZINOF|nr:hypothetical protein ZIOFF_070695 [Zingiber officinale]